MPIRILDKGNGFVIQKVIKPNGELVRYQTVPEVRTPGDNERIVFWSRLSAARKFIGKEIQGSNTVGRAK
jgi:hypothetical protein